MSSLESEFQLPTQLLDPTFQSCAAVTRCRKAWDQSFKSDSMRRDPCGPALDKARAAYCKAMPPLIGYDNIRDFIACVAQGLLLGAITDSRGSRLLYAAQVAQGVLRSQPVRKDSV